MTTIHPRRCVRRFALGCVLIALSVLVASKARAETLQAPIGGKAIWLGDSRVVCPGPLGDWVAELDGHAVKPPSADGAIGVAIEVKVAANAAACSTASPAVTLVATGRWPSIDPLSTTLYVDEGRVEVAGHGLRGMLVRYSAAGRSGQDRCTPSPGSPGDGGVEHCSVAVARTLAADPASSELHWAPAGWRAGPGVTLFDSSGHPVAPEDLLLAPSRVVVSALVAPDVTIDLAGGTASRIALAHPEAVVDADCGAVSCNVAGGAILVGGLTSVVSALTVRLRLAPHVFFSHGQTLDAAPAINVPILPCAMSVASGEALRDLDATRAVVRVDSRCAAEARDLRWFSAGRALDVIGAVDSGGAVFVLIQVGRVEGDELVLTASRAAGDGSTVGQARTHTRAAPLPHSTLALDTDDNIDFVPTNRPASVRWARVQGSGELAIVPVDGVYSVETHEATTEVKGERGAGGVVALRFAWRAPSLPGSLATTDLAVIADPVERPMHEAAVAVALGASSGHRPIVEMLCGSGDKVRPIAAGESAHIAFDARDACRMVLHGERLLPEDGAQRLQLEVDVRGVDGSARSEAHVTQPIVLRSGRKPSIFWIKGIAGPFDRATIRLSRTGDTSGDGSVQNEPSLQWAIVFGNDHFRLYATTAIPTGLYRVSDRSHSGILSLNLAVVMRTTWLDDDGHEGVLGLEGGVLAEGLANDVDASGHSLTQVAAVVGVGLSVPIANRSLATETSINLHAWVEYEVSRDLGREPGSPLGFVFGPSISIGNVGTNL